MRQLMILVPLLSLAACAPAIPETGKSGGDTGLDGSDDGGDGGDAGGDAGDDGGDPGDGGGDGGGDPDPTPADYAGSWSGMVYLQSSTGGGGWGDLSCEGGLDVEVDNDGTAMGRGDCDMGWGQAFGLEYLGAVDAQGEFSGDLLLVTDWSDPAVMALSGQAEDGFLFADVAGEMQVGGWGDQTYTIELVGSAELERN